MTQIEKQIDSQSSFNKDSGAPINKGQIFQAPFNNNDVSKTTGYGDPLLMLAEESLLL